MWKPATKWNAAEITSGVGDLKVLLASISLFALLHTICFF